jgi:hypothetical protein
MASCIQAEWDIPLVALVFVNDGRWTIGVLEFDYRRGLGIFLFTTASRTAVAHPASYPMGTRDCLLGYSGRGVKATTSI